MQHNLETPGITSVKRLKWGRSSDVANLRFDSSSTQPHVKCQQQFLSFSETEPWHDAATAEHCKAAVVCYILANSISCVPSVPSRGPVEFSFANWSCGDGVASVSLESCARSWYGSHVTEMIYRVWATQATYTKFKSGRNLRSSLESSAEHSSELWFEFARHITKMWCQNRTRQETPRSAGT